MQGQAFKGGMEGVREWGRLKLGTTKECEPSKMLDI